MTSGHPVIHSRRHTLNDINFQVVKRIGKDFDISGNLPYEHWKAPIYLPAPPPTLPTSKP
jgi:hypothetical protein